ncbi:MAG: M28 family peptidase [Calditrichia bacterium]
MKRGIVGIFLFLIFFVSLAFAQETAQLNEIVGSAYLENHSYQVLERICDEAGGRLVGSPLNEKAQNILKEELEKDGWQVKSEKFSIPGWVRGDDEVLMTAPARRRLQAVALGYVGQTPAFEAPGVYAAYGFPEDYENVDAKDKIVLVTSEKPEGKEGLLRQEAIEIAADKGARAILFINTKPGGLNLAGTGDFQGNPTRIPAFSLTMEEGQWLQRLLENNIPVKLSMTVRSRNQPVETSNIVLTLPGKVKKKIVVGAHFDSWDLGQGGIDNGLGTAILFDAARLMKKFSPQNYYTVEFVWFNGEELGLWGSKKYLEMHRGDDIAAMINMDMTGTPVGFNAMGFDELVPFLQNLEKQLPGFDLSRGVMNRPWTNSDNQPFMLEGIPTISLLGHLDDEMVKYYHTRADTYDKVNKEYLSDATAVVTVLLKELANDEQLPLKNKNSDEVVEMLKKYHLDKRLKHQKEWPFGNR